MRLFRIIIFISVSILFCILEFPSCGSESIGANAPIGSPFISTDYLVTDLNYPSNVDIVLNINYVNNEQYFSGIQVFIDTNLTFVIETNINGAVTNMTTNWFPVYPLSGILIPDAKRVTNQSQYQQSSNLLTIYNMLTASTGWTNTNFLVLWDPFPPYQVSNYFETNNAINIVTNFIYSNTNGTVTTNSNYNPSYITYILTNISTNTNGVLTTNTTTVIITNPSMSVATNISVNPSVYWFYAESYSLIYSIASSPSDIFPVDYNPSNAGP